MNLIPLVFAVALFVVAVATAIVRPPIQRTVRTVTLTVTVDATRFVAACEAAAAALTGFNRAWRRPPVPPLIQWPLLERGDR